MEIINNKFLVDFGMAKSILHFRTKKSLEFQIIEQDGKPANNKETVAIKITQLRPNLFMVTWVEKNGNTITQVQDYKNGIIYSNWTLPNGKFKNVKGTLKIYRGTAG